MLSVVTNQLCQRAFSAPDRFPILPLLLPLFSWCLLWLYLSCAPSKPPCPVLAFGLQRMRYLLLHSLFKNASTNWTEKLRATLSASGYGHIHKKVWGISSCSLVGKPSAENPSHSLASFLQTMQELVCWLLLIRSIMLPCCPTPPSTSWLSLNVASVSLTRI